MLSRPSALRWAAIRSDLPSAERYPPRHKALGLHPEGCADQKPMWRFPSSGGVTNCLSASRIMFISLSCRATALSNSISQFAPCEFHSLMAAPSLTDHCDGPLPHSHSTRYTSCFLPRGRMAAIFTAVFLHLVQCLIAPWGVSVFMAGKIPGNAGMVKHDVTGYVKMLRIVPISGIAPASPQGNSYALPPFPPFSPPFSVTAMRRTSSSASRRAGNCRTIWSIFGRDRTGRASSSPSTDRSRYCCPFPLRIHTGFTLLLSKRVRSHSAGIFALRLAQEIEDCLIPRYAANST